MHPLDPSAVNVVQDVIVAELQAGFTRVQAIAWPLLYGFAVLELVLVGLGIALGRRAVASDLLGTVIKIGFIVFLIHNYAYLLQAVLGGFSLIGEGLGGGGVMATVQEAMAKPAVLWGLGYDPALRLFEVAAKADAQQPGIALIYTGLGFGILLSFGLIAAQVVFAIVAFYVVALVGLLLVPLGIFRPTEGLLDRALGQILAAGARVLATGLIAGALVALWSKLDLHDFKIDTPIDQPIGLWLVAITFALLIIKLPAVAARVVGPIVSGRRAATSGGSAELAIRRSEAPLPVAPVAALRQGVEVGPLVDRGARDDRPPLPPPATVAATVAATSSPGVVQAIASPAGTMARIEGPRHDGAPAARDGGAGFPGRASGLAAETLAAAFHKMLLQDRQRQSEIARKARRLRAMRVAAGRRPDGRRG
jgi:hypothetical protein